MWTFPNSVSQTMCRGTILCREEIENVPENFNSIKDISNISVFWTHKEVMKLPYFTVVINLTITSTSRQYRYMQYQPQHCFILTKIRFQMVLCRGQILVIFLCRETKKFENYWHIRKCQGNVIFLQFPDLDPNYQKSRFKTSNLLYEQCWILPG